MSKKLNIAVIDTETATLWGEVFDFGMVITNKKGDVIDTYDSIVKEVYDNIPLMKKAFYFNKVDSFYRPNVRCNRMTVKPWAQICSEVLALTEKHDINVVAAYNLAFDARVIKATHKKYNGSAMFSKPVKQLDLWRVCCETLLQQKNFKKLAKELKWVSPAGNLRTNAQVSYRYGMGEWEFDESHTALDDALIETKIMKKVFSTKQKINYGLIAHPWRLVQEKKA